MVSEQPGRRGGRGRRGPWCAPWVRGDVEKRAAGMARCSGTVEQGAAARAGGGHGRDEGEVSGAAARGGGAWMSYARPMPDSDELHDDYNNGVGKKVGKDGDPKKSCEDLCKEKLEAGELSTDANPAAKLKED